MPHILLCVIPFETLHRLRLYLLLAKASLSGVVVQSIKKRSFMSKGKSCSDVDIVFNFLAKENRPFSVQNIVDALQKQGVKKTAVERALATLVEKGQVNKKEYGKAKVFLLAQDKLELPDAEDIASLDKQVSDLVAELEQYNQRVASKREDVSGLKNQYTLEDAKIRVDLLEDEISLKTSKRSKLGDGSMLFSKEEKLAIDRSYYDLRLLWKKYRGLVNGVLDQMSEGTGKKKSELIGEIGIETDEDANIDLHDFPEVGNPSTARKGGLLDRDSKRRKLS